VCIQQVIEGLDVELFQLVTGYRWMVIGTFWIDSLRRWAVTTIS